MDSFITARCSRLNSFNSINNNSFDSFNSLDNFESLQTIQVQCVSKFACMPLDQNFAFSTAVKAVVKNWTSRKC